MDTVNVVTETFCVIVRSREERVIVKSTLLNRYVLFLKEQCRRFCSFIIRYSIKSHDMRIQYFNYN